MTHPREHPSRRATNASSATIMPGTRAGAPAVRPGLRQTTKRGPTARHVSGIPSSLSSSAPTPGGRISRMRATSPAESVASIATTGTKRKEREFELEGPSVGEETNINVVVRCRGRTEREVRENSAVVATTDGAMGKTVELSMGPNALSNKTYNFDRPILDQMMTGFNCTIFAYGQTGTGKTYTMSGDMTETLGLLTDAAGIIPRVLQALFQKLEADASDSIVRCSFIELYNEELRDLLSAEADSGGGMKLKIYDDNTRKGHGTTVVQGMEERHLASAADGIQRLQEGSIRRQVAATKCNDLSSRSHTVFTITVQTKHVAESGEDFYVTGKLNLVDLAGSENIQRSGAENKRAAEAGLINKSLLTLGRVINALVDRTAHVPYRESKLTRLLQDSLGGRTKTCIIATVSTAKSNLEETISTLDYAFRAKNIRNKPQVNQLVSKKTLLREFTAEIEKLKSELIVTRQRNGVYLALDAYEEMTVQSESRRILAEEQAARIETMENSLRHKLQELLDLTSSFMGLKKDHEGARVSLDATKAVLDETETVLAATRDALADETRVRQAHEATERQLAVLGDELIRTLGRTVDDIDGLRAKGRRRSDLHGANRNTWTETQARVADVTRLVEGRIADLRASQDAHVTAMAEHVQAFVHDGRQDVAGTQAALDASLAVWAASHDELLTQQRAAKGDVDAILAELRVVRAHMQQRVGESLESIAAAAERIAEDVLSELGAFHDRLHASYDTLGQDCQSLLDDVLRQLRDQRSESDALRRTVEAASRAAAQSSAVVAAQIAEAVEEERRVAAADRQQLLAQIGSLVSAQASVQEARFAARAEAIREQVAQSGQSLEEGVATYSKGMDVWNAAADELVQDMSTSGERVKNKLKDDWTTANNHSISIKETTESVHAETIRVVEEQKTDLDVQMQGLDNLVAKAAAYSKEHQARQGVTAAKASAAVTSCLSETASRAQETHERTEALGTALGRDLDGLRDSLAPIESTLAQPLVGLRSLVSSTSLREYVPTGETPEKVKYEIPTELPRTAARHVIIGVEATEEDKDDEDDDGGEDESNVGLSPSTTIFADLDQSLQAKSPSPGSTSLREMNANVGRYVQEEQHAVDTAVEEEHAAAATQAGQDEELASVAAAGTRERAASGVCTRLIKEKESAVKLGGREEREAAWGRRSAGAKLVAQTAIAYFGVFGYPLMQKGSYKALDSR
ncbi:kinesin family protein [Grosmannia clavigera kw1407]|uniref:Kinesin family protein n=1 Tax=Grosmannia clavigera (strain kw1407 / UAMH 11150) TaxID=655863 RepID=F0XU29_GROCL|nr:kinesin family protein [Grosmannia clavigera kw1407]EFW98497.1 kinesin family protein [Grosmannia clavigera kw1407]